MLLTTILSWAVVTLSSSFMRQAPDYESALDNQMLMGALVETLDSERYWVKVKAEDYTGWVTDMGLKVLSDREKDEYLAAPKWICTTDYTHIYESPSASSQPLTDFTMGNLVRQKGSATDGWTEVLLPDGRTGWVESACIADFGQWARSRKACPCKIVSLARSFLGTPYMWGGNSVKHFDCSGLVKLCYFMNGIILPRNASQQAKCGVPVGEGKFRKGDLLFFGSKNPLRITHVGIYIGDGKIIHSSHLVRINTLEEYGREVVAATRVLGTTDSGNGAISILDSPYYFPQGDKAD